MLTTILIYIDNANRSHLKDIVAMDRKPALPGIGGTDCAPEPLRRIASGELFQGGSTVEIEHAGQRYLLRITRENKLILTK